MMRFGSRLLLPLALLAAIASASAASVLSEEALSVNVHLERTISAGDVAVYSFSVPSNLRKAIPDDFEYDVSTLTSDGISTGRPHGGVGTCKGTSCYDGPRKTINFCDGWNAQLGEVKVQFRIKNTNNYLNAKFKVWAAYQACQCPKRAYLRDKLQMSAWCAGGLANPDWYPDPITGVSLEDISGGCLTVGGKQVCEPQGGLVCSTGERCPLDDPNMTLAPPSSSNLAPTPTPNKGAGASAGSYTVPSGVNSNPSAQKPLNWHLYYTNAACNDLEWPVTCKTGAGDKLSAVFTKSCVTINGKTTYSGTCTRTTATGGKLEYVYHIPATITMTLSGVYSDFVAAYGSETKAMDVIYAEFAKQSGGALSTSQTWNIVAIYAGSIVITIAADAYDSTTVTAIENTARAIAASSGFLGLKATLSSDNAERPAWTIATTANKPTDQAPSSSNNPSSSGSSNTVALAAGIGGGVGGAVLLAAIGTTVYCMKRKRHNRNVSTGRQASATSTGPALHAGNDFAKPVSVQNVSIAVADDAYGDVQKPAQLVSSSQPAAYAPSAPPAVNVAAHV